MLSLKFSFVGHVTCYAVAFYFALLFTEEHQKSLQACCLVAGVVSLPIPAFYYYKNKELIGRAAESAPLKVERSTGRRNSTYTDLVEANSNEQNGGSLYADGTEIDSQQKQVVS